MGRAGGPSEAGGEERRPSGMDATTGETPWRAAPGGHGPPGRGRADGPARRSPRGRATDGGTRVAGPAPRRPRRRPGFGRWLRLVAAVAVAAMVLGCDVPPSSPANRPAGSPA